MLTTKRARSQPAKHGSLVRAIIATQERRKRTSLGALRFLLDDHYGCMIECSTRSRRLSRSDDADVISRANVLTPQRYLDCAVRPEPPRSRPFQRPFPK